MMDRMMLKIAGSAWVNDIESPPGWYALHLRSVVLMEMSRCRCPHMLSPFGDSSVRVGVFIHPLSCKPMLTCQLRHDL